MVEVKVNSNDFVAPRSYSILEACKYLGIQVPRFCYHEILSVSGNCRMCLVEIEGMEKPLASCVAEIDEGMTVWTETPFVKKARENVIETLLLNHPLDCPICDQAGECDLQDQTKVYGNTHSRYFFPKTTSEDKYCGPLIKTIMTRCITCTRCVRFATEVAGIEFFGTLNRGGSTEIGSYLGKMFESEISGNVIDLCPVGAITAKPYAFKIRPWELRFTESIDITDSLGSNVYVNYKETEIFRVIPKSNNNINGSLISDRARFSYDANMQNRLNYKYQYSEEEDVFNELSWINFFSGINAYISSKNKIYFVLDEKCDLETALYLKRISNKFPEKVHVSASYKSSFIKNFYISWNKYSFKKLNSGSDLYILFGSNLRLESAILNARVRFNYKNFLMNVNSMGLHFDENVPTSFVNLNISKILEVIEGKSYFLSKLLSRSKTPTIFIGENFSNRVDNISTFISKLTSIFSNLNIFQISSSPNSEGLAFLNLHERSSKSVKNTVAINLDDNIVNRRLYLNNNENLMWFSSHGSFLSTKFKYILPILTPFENEQIYINFEGRPQMTQQVADSSNEMEAVSILILALFNIDLKEVKTTISDKNSPFSFIAEILKYPFKFNFKTAKFNLTRFTALVSNTNCLISTYPIKQQNKDFYSIDTFTRNSLTMQKCSLEKFRNHSNFSV